MSIKPRPWQEPGFRFFTEDMQRFLSGYVPKLGAQYAAPAMGKPRDAAAAERIADARRRGSQSRREMAAASAA